MEIINRVAESEIEIYNLEHLWDNAPVVELDIKPFLVSGLMVREKPFRHDVARHPWSQYTDQHVAIYCSTPAIVPTWAYMLIITYLSAHARSTTLGRTEDVMHTYYTRALAAENWAPYQDRIVVIKGCTSVPVPISAYVTATEQLQRVARKLMYGEPCSSVPLWRRPKQTSTSTILHAH